MICTDVKQLKHTLESIETKIKSCHSLAKILEYYEQGHPIPQEWKDSTEDNLVRLYIDLERLCKEKGLF